MSKRLNAQLVWLAKQVGIKDPCKFAYSDAFLAGAIHGRFTAQVELIRDELNKANVRLDKLEGEPLPNAFVIAPEIQDVEKAWDVLKAARNETEIIDALANIQRLIKKLKEPQRGNWEQYVSRWLKDYHRDHPQAV